MSSPGKLYKTLFTGMTAVLVLLAGCTQPSDRELLSSAKSYLERNDRKAAVIQLKAALEQKPNFGEARFLLGKTLLEMGDSASAEIELEKAANLQYSEDHVLPEQARVMLQRGEDRKVVQRYDGAKLLDPTAIADLKTSLAAAHLNLEEKEAASAALDAALASRADFAPAKLLRARMGALQRDFSSAESLVDEVLQKDPKSAEAWTLKGTFLMLPGRDEVAALAAFRKAVDADPTYLPAEVKLFAFLLRQRDQAGFEAQLQKLRTALPGHPQTRFYEAQVLVMRGDLAKAREATELLLRDLPDNVGALQMAGAIELQTRRTMQAEQYLIKALRLAPGSWMARRLLAETYLRAGETDKALNLLSPMVETGTSDTQVLALAAEAHLVKGEPRRADELFSRAAKASPADLRIRTAMAVGRLSKGEVDPALGELENIAATDTSARADLALISTLVGHGRLDQALVAIDALERKQPRLPLASTLRGRVEGLRRHNDAARKSYEKALGIDPSYFAAAVELASMDLADKHVRQAEQRFEAVLEANPKQWRAFLALAELKQRAGGTPEEVRDLVTRAVRADPTATMPRSLLINHYLTWRDYKFAVSEAQSAIAAIPDDPALQVLLGEAQFRLGDKEQALSTYSKLVASHPRLDSAYLRLADFQLAINRPSEAEQTLLKLLEFAPRNLDAQLALLTLRSKTGRVNEALAMARTIQNQYPKRGVGWLVEGDLRAGRDEQDAALRVYRNGLKAERNPQLAVKVHTSLLAKGQKGQAETFARQWERDFPRDAVFLFHLGELATVTGNYVAAELRFREVLAVRADDARALNNLAYLMIKQGKPGALPLALKANGLMPDQPAFVDTLAMALATDRQYPRAIELQRRAVQAAPEVPALRLNLAKIYLQSGDKAAARHELEFLKPLGANFAGQPEVARLLSTL